MADEWRVLVFVCLAAVPPTVMAALAALASHRNAHRIHEVYRALNGRVDQLVEEARRGAFAAGIKDEHDRGQAEDERGADLTPTEGRCGRRCWRRYRG